MALALALYSTIAIVLLPFGVLIAPLAETDTLAAADFATNREALLRRGIFIVAYIAALVIFYNTAKIGQAATRLSKNAAEHVATLVEERAFSLARERFYRRGDGRGLRRTVRPSRC